METISKMDSIIYSLLREISLKYDYALYVHPNTSGELYMDIALIPWVQKAGNPIPMLEEMRDKLSIKLMVNMDLMYWCPLDKEGKCSYAPISYPFVHLPEKGMAPHGRQWWALTTKGGMTIDITITPLLVSHISEPDWKEPPTSEGVPQYSEYTC